MGLFSKVSNKTETKSSVRTISYPIEVRSWNIHTDGVHELIKSTGIDLNELTADVYLRCKVVPEPDNESDPDALKVYAAPKGRSKDFYDIGYIPSEYTSDIKPDVKKAVAGTHYWSLRMRFDVFQGIRFTLSLKESKFK